MQASATQPQYSRSTANVFGLPVFCHYGIGGPGFGAWRELAVQTMTTNWVLAGEYEGFPMMYHWRVLPSSPQPLPGELADVDRAVAYWGGGLEVRRRIEALQNSSAAVVLFLEYIPQNLHDWLGAQVALGGHAAEQACAMVERELAAGTSFMNAQGLLHFDAHFENILTDGRRLFFADYGLAISSRFELDKDEADFFDRHRTYDACYTVTHLVRWLATALYGYDAEGRTAFVRACANGAIPADVPTYIASIFSRHAPLAAVMGDFSRELQQESRTTPYPLEALRRIGQRGGVSTLAPVKTPWIRYEVRADVHLGLLGCADHIRMDGRARAAGLVPPQAAGDHDRVQRRERLHDLLLRAGLTVGDEVSPGSLFPPEAGWRVARGISAPDGVVREALDAEWWRRLCDVDGEFLVAVLGHRIGGNDSWWTRVRHVRIGVPELTGDPGFVALSLDGQVLLAEVPGEDGTRVTAIDRLPERLEQAAVAAGRETEAERAGVWADVPGRAAWPLHWAEGIGFNPAATDELLIRLLDVEESFLHGCDRPTVLDAAVAHPDPRVRSRAADTFRPKLSSDQWVRLIRAEPSPSRRVFWAERARIRGAALPEDLYDYLLAGPSRAQAAELPGLPAQHLPGLAADADPRVRMAACVRWEDLAAPLRERLLADTDHAVRTAALLAHHTAVPMPRESFAALPDTRPALERCRFAPELESELVRDGDAEVRRALAANPGLGPHGVAVLAEDPRGDIRSAVALRADLTEEQRAAVRHDFDPTSVSHTLPWVEDLHGDADAMRRLAASSHSLVRRSVARARHLPPEVVALLARDEDRAVRLFLAESCEDAPADMLLEVWRWWDGSFSHPDRPRNHPNFPRTGLLRYTADPSGRMRRLVLDDPESTPADVARLARDPEAEARRRAAEDTRLSPADAVRLLNDPEAQVRDTALRNPRLPTRVLAGLLHDRDTARAAVTNPAIPVPVLYRILTAAAAAVAALR